MNTTKNNRGQWKGQIGFVMAAVGSAIGLGNIWRFSYMAYENGGGAFLIPYLLALLTAGIPLLLLEFAIGHERIGSAPLAYHKVKKSSEWLGWWAVTFVMFGIVLYYIVIISWCVNYFILSFDLGWGDSPNDFFFKEFLMISEGPHDVGQIRWAILAGTCVIWFINSLIVYRGVGDGIELANKVFMPLLFILTTILVFWSINLEGSFKGIAEYIKPDFSRILHTKVWIDAYSQIFFTLSLGFGIMIAYASYLPDNSDISKSAFMTGLINSGFSLFAGFGTFAIVGYMATSQGKDISEVVTQKIGLAFVAYPQALSIMPGGRLFGALFFLSLVVAGLSSSVSITEAFICALADKFGYTRRTLIIVVSLFGLLGSLIFTTQGGLFWLDIVDHYLTHYGLVVVGIVECIIVGWFFNFDLLRKHVNKVSSIKMGSWWNYIIKYFIPSVLGVILVVDISQELSKAYGGYSWNALLLIGVMWIVATLIASFIIASRPWRTNKQNERGRAC
jgi:NSS family neurotransmitter:Na+ symporter